MLRGAMLGPSLKLAKRTTGTLSTLCGDEESKPLSAKRRRIKKKKAKRERESVVTDSQKQAVVQQLKKPGTGTSELAILALRSGDMMKSAVQNDDNDSDLSDYDDLM